MEQEGSEPGEDVCPQVPQGCCCSCYSYSVPVPPVWDNPMGCDGWEAFCCDPMADVGSALEGHQHPFMGKGLRAECLKGKGVSGHEMENLGIFGVQSVSGKGRAVAPRPQCKQVTVGTEMPIPVFSTDSLERVKTFPEDQCGTPMLVPPYSSALRLQFCMRIILGSRSLKDAVLQRVLHWGYWEQLCFS